MPKKKLYHVCSAYYNIINGVNSKLLSDLPYMEIT